LLFAGYCMPCVVCRALHTANTLPCVNRLLSCAFGTRQMTCVHYGNWIFAVCPIVCREPKLGHTAKDSLAVCLKWSSRQTTGTRQRTLLPCAAERDTRQTITTRQKFSNCNGFTSLPCANGQNTRQTFVTRQIFWNRNGSPVLPCAMDWSFFAVGFFVCQCQSLSTRQSIGEKIKLSLPKFSKIHIFYMGLDVNIWYFLKSIPYI